MSVSRGVLFNMPRASPPTVGPENQAVGKEEQTNDALIKRVEKEEAPGPPRSGDGLGSAFFSSLDISVRMRSDRS